MSESHFEAPDLETLSRLLPAYEFKAFIAKGGMGAVYLARQRSLDRNVAIKVLPRELGENAEFRRSFETEARAMARLNHPNLIGVYASGEVDGMLYLAMEYVPGKSLFHSADGRVIAPRQAVELVAGICRGLAHAHEAGVIHRDIKPANILLTPKREPKIGDFGLARPTDSQEHGLAMGTPDYVAPEVLQDHRQADERSDVYAVGVILYELLTGRVPQSGDPPPSECVDCDPVLDEIWERATQKDPAERYPSASSMAAELQAWLDEDSADQSDNAPLSRRRARRQQRRRGGAAAPGPIHWPLVLNLAIIVVLLGAIYLTWQHYQERLAEQAHAELPASAPKAPQEPDAHPPSMAPVPPPEATAAVESEADTTSQAAPLPQVDAGEPAETPAQSLRRLRDALASGERDEMPIGTVAREGSFYFPVSASMSWDQARRFAEAYGGHLPLIDDPAEANWIAIHLTESRGIWVGASREADGRWHSIDGSPWPAEVPIAGEGSCIMLNGEGRFVAAAEDGPLPFVIEWAQDGSNPTALREMLARTMASLDEGGGDYFPRGTVTLGDDHRLVVQQGATLAEAEELATLGGGRLMVPATEEEADWLESATNSLAKDSQLWLGGFRDGHEWKWNTGEAWTFARWQPGRPSGRFDALALAVGAGWTDADPEQAVAGFIIEWGRSPAATPSTEDVAGSPAVVRRKAEELLLALDKQRREKLKDNAKSFEWELSVWLRRQTEGDTRRWTPSVERIKRGIRDSRIPAGLPKRPTESYPERLLKIASDYLERQQEIDKDFITRAAAIRTAYTGRLAEANAAARQRGQPELAAAIEATIRAAADLKGWISSFDAIGTLADPRISPVRIISATYGSGGRQADVTARVSQIVEEQQRDFWVNPRELGADPTPGWNKQLTIVFEIDGKKRTLSRVENSKIPIASFTSG